MHHRAWYGVAAFFVGAWLWQYASAPDAVRYLAGLDYNNYADATRSWMEGNGWYLPRQLDGPYVVKPGDVLYPPVWLLLFVPASILPPILWWAIPIGLVGWMAASHRPAPLAWATMAAFVAWPPTAVHLLTGNPGIWLVAALALGTRFKWPSVFLLTKLTIAPLALFGARDRRWWVAAGVLVLLCIPFAPMWPTYVQVLRDATTVAPFLYSAQDLPMLMLPLVAWALRRREPGTGPSGESADAQRDGQGLPNTQPSGPA